MFYLSVLLNMRRMYPLYIRVALFSLSYSYMSYLQSLRFSLSSVCLLSTLAREPIFFSFHFGIIGIFYVLRIILPDFDEEDLAVYLLRLHFL